MLTYLQFKALRPKKKEYKVNGLVENIRKTPVF